MFVLPRLSHYSDSRGQALKDSRRHLYLADVFPLPYSSRDKQLLRPWVGVKVHRTADIIVPDRLNVGYIWPCLQNNHVTMICRDTHAGQGSYRVAGPPAAIWCSRQAWKRPRLPGISMWGMHSHHPLSLAGHQYMYTPDLLAIAACCPQRGLHLA